MYCRDCSGYDKCLGELDADRFRDTLKTGLERLGLSLRAAPEPVGYKKYLLRPNEETSRGDETYLSELCDVKIKLDTVDKGSMEGKCIGSGEVLKRWDATGFFPVAEMKQVACELLEIIREKTSGLILD